MNNPFEEIKENNLEIKGENILTKIDDFEENIKLLNKLDKEYLQELARQRITHLNNS